MSRYLNNRNEVVPGGFRFRQPETGFLVTGPSWKDLLVNIQKHRMANNIPVGSNFEQDIEDAVCAGAPPNWCSDNNPNRTAEMEFKDWPLWAKTISLAKNDQDAGVGSTVERVIGPFGGTAFKTFYEATFSRPCGCSERAAAWDALYPYKRNE